MAVTHTARDFFTTLNPQEMLQSEARELRRLADKLDELAGQGGQ